MPCHMGRARRSHQPAGPTPPLRRCCAAAVPWYEHEVHELVNRLWAESQDAANSWLRQLASLQLATVAVYLWEGGQRGKEAGLLTALDHTDR